MSYILDALKKSEQERGKGDIPSVQTVHSSSLNYNDNKNIYWPYILIAAVILNFLAISYFIFSKEKSMAAIPTQPSIEVIEEETESFKEIKVEARQNNDISQDNKNTSSNVTVKPVTKPVEKPLQKKQSTSRPTILDYYDLPDSIKSRLPTINVSAHVFSKNPLQRSIVINNNFMEEGEYVSKELILHEITRDGAIFDFEGNLINYSVVSKWQ